MEEQPQRFAAAERRKIVAARKQRVRLKTSKRLPPEKHE
jgi:hypothetical protein